MTSPPAPIHHRSLVRPRLDSLLRLGHQQASVLTAASDLDLVADRPSLLHHQFLLVCRERLVVDDCLAVPYHLLPPRRHLVRMGHLAPTVE